MVLCGLMALGMVSCSTKIIDTVEVDGGKLQGVPGKKENVMAFRGIPYAAPPVGDLRWKAPQDVIPWEGVKVADSYGNPAIQFERAEGSFYYKEFQYEPLAPVSEDCLFLNVWTPATAVGHPEAKLPVAMWIHGGGLFGGTGNEKTFDGSAWADRGVIMVTINYRLGYMGFLSHPELSAETGYGASGNWGNYDQLQAIKWIHNNIAQFGGDPDNLTILGQSAGAGSVRTLVSSPLAKGLVAKAIIQSGGGLNPKDAPKRPTINKDSLNKVALDAAGFDSLEKMRKATWQEIMAVEGLQGGNQTDHNLIVKSFDEAVYDGTIMDIPYMIGSTGNDMNAENLAKSCAAFGEYMNAHGSHPAYVYFFDRKLPGDDAGAFHSSELWYMFQNMDLCWRPMTEHDFALSDKMMDYWTNFAKYGNPNGEGETTWKPCTEQDPYVEMLK